MLQVVIVRPTATFTRFPRENPGFCRFARFEKRCCLKPAGYLSIALFENTFTLPRLPILVSFITWIVRTTFYAIVRSPVENAGKRHMKDFALGIILKVRVFGTRKRPIVTQNYWNI